MEGAVSVLIQVQCTFDAVPLPRAQEPLCDAVHVLRAAGRDDLIRE